MLELSGRYPATGPPRPIELTVVVGSEVHPWRYPPQRELQYGEWLREGFERRDPELWRPVADPDLAVLCTMVLVGDAALVGPPPSRVIDAVPWTDVLDTSLGEIPSLIADIITDPRNVVLTLARIWNSVVSGQVLAKDAAVEWGLPRLPAEHRAVLVRARDIYLGTRPNDWDDLRDALPLPGFVDAVVAEIRLARLIEPLLGTFSNARAADLSLKARRDSTSLILTLSNSGGTRASRLCHRNLGLGEVRRPPGVASTRL